MYWISTHPEFKNSTGDPIQGQPDNYYMPHRPRSPLVVILTPAAFSEQVPQHSVVQLPIAASASNYA